MQARKNCKYICGTLLPAGFAVEDPDNCAVLIKEHKFSEEIFRGIRDLQKQQERQIAGVKLFR